MNWIQVILILGFLLASTLCLAALKHRLIARLFFICQFALGICLTLAPDFTSTVAQRLGVGRGADLITYLLVLYVYVGSILILGKFRRLESDITTLTRSIALQNHTPPPPTESSRTAPESKP
ncbi:MAG: DUF2304 domain-containing protein [Oligosphaeraceae bacterium]|nr:DUF2304 domain-containing protein [Oligosphaeraceae bacterium]